MWRTCGRFWSLGEGLYRRQLLDLIERSHRRMGAEQRLRVEPFAGWGARPGRPLVGAIEQRLCSAAVMDYEHDPVPYLLEIRPFVNFQPERGIADKQPVFRNALHHHEVLVGPAADDRNGG